MVNILDMLSKEERPLEVIPMADYDFQVTFENATQVFKDLMLAAEVEEAILTTENAELIAYHLGRLGITEEDGGTLTTESALKGKEGFLAKIKDVTRKILEQSDGTFGHISALYKSMTGKSVNKLAILRAKLAAGELVTVDKISDKDQKIINNKLGMFNAMGMNAGNVGDFIKLVQLPRELAKTVIPENSKFLEIIYSGILPNTGKLKAEYDKGELPSAPNSVKFLKSIKGVEFRDGIETLSGLPFKVFGENLTFVTIYLEKGKVNIDSDIVMNKTTDIKPLSTADAIKLIDAAIKEIVDNQKLVDELVSSSKAWIIKWAGLGKTISGWLVKGTVNNGSHQGIFTNASRLHRYFGYYLDSTRNLSYDFYEINNFTQKLVTASTKKKEEGV